MNTTTKDVIIFTDGSSRENPGPGGWAAVIVFGGREVVELGGYDKSTTNNRMELQAAISALSYLKSSPVSNLKVIIYTDSSYLINGITSWIYSWERNSWKTKNKQDVLNRDLWEELRRVSDNLEVTYDYVGGHIGVKGNERADKIATSFADLKEDKLYEGDIENYSIPDIVSGKFLKSDSVKEVSKKKKSSSKKPYGYVSMVAGDFKFYKDWNMCKAEVLGKRGAKYQKVFSKQEADLLKNQWSDV
ncbi:MAG: ribonuclease HI [Parcubacteria group bacterium CG11_big_fil_rev_8_21_14_0_20_39_22]|nr:MAG: ribonuclease HI [Parcubacteria group bacterium CG11_big_fil_rev_8_21_14_0_20_39_22]